MLATGLITAGGGAGCGGLGKRLPQLALQSDQNPLNRSGANAVYRAVDCKLPCPR
jgi:hypothetical protein